MIPSIEHLETTSPDHIDITDAGAVTLFDVCRMRRELPGMPDRDVAALAKMLVDPPGGPASLVFDEMVRRMERFWSYEKGPQ